jgi:threonine aldolase
MIIDLRSDTFTKPSPAMLEQMFKAEVGDDVFGEDPTVNKLESLTAEMFGTEAALFCPSGTMTNQVAMKCHTQPGDEVICDKTSHVYIYEGGGIAFNSSCQIRPLDGDRGRLHASMIKESINPDDVHKPVTRVVSVENTANRGGGSCYEISDLQEIKEVCLKNNLKFHLDGARIWNAMVAKAEKPRVYGELFDSISICLSKGLGAPVGSLLLGEGTFIKKARRVRKVFGGGMRQAGYLAAAGIYALTHNIERLSQDHAHAREIANALAKKDFTGNILPVETNILIFEIKGRLTPGTFVEIIRKENILCIAISDTHVRMVTHLDVTPAMVSNLVSVIEKM